MADGQPKAGDDGLFSAVVREPTLSDKVAAAITEGGAILLTNGPKQSSETAAYLAAHQGVVRYAIGGPLAAAGADPTASP